MKHPARSTSAPARPQPATAALSLSLSLALGLACGLLLASAGPAGAAEAEAPALSNRATQTDAGIQADQQGYARQQQAIAGLNATGLHRLAGYSLAKAQCWLDTSFHEYHQNDRSAYPQEALQQSLAITRYLAGNGSVQAPANPAWETPLVDRALPLRPDLWKRLEAVKDQLRKRLKDGTEDRCGEEALACAEVELVHAGHEHLQLGWRHAKPYIQMAEDYVAQAEAASKACHPTDVLKVVIDVLPPREVVKEVVKEVVVVREVPERAVYLEGERCTPSPAEACQPQRFMPEFTFEFDKAVVTPAMRADVARWAGNLMEYYSQIRTIELIGHTDRLGNAARNEKLSDERVKAIRAELAKFLPQTTITAHGEGKRFPTEETTRKCRADTPTDARELDALRKCLAPDRRVEARIDGTERVYKGGGAAAPKAPDAPR